MLLLQSCSASSCTVCVDVYAHWNPELPFVVHSIAAESCALIRRYDMHQKFV